MADKKLTIALAADIKEGQKLDKFFQNLEKRGKKVSESFKDLAGGWKNKNNLTEGLTKQKRLFDDLGISATRLSKILKEQLINTQAAVAKQLADSTINIDRLVKKYDFASDRLNKLKQRGAPDWQIELARKRQMLWGGRILGTGEQIQNLLGEEETGTAGGVGGSFRRGASSIMSTLGLGQYSGLMRGGMGAAGAAGIGVAIGTAILKTIESASGAQYTYPAMLGNAVGANLSALTSFDPSYTYGMGSISNDPNKRNGMAAATLSQTTFGGLKSALTIGGWYNYFANNGPNPWTTGVESAYVKGVAERANQETQKNPELLKHLSVLTEDKDLIAHHLRRYGRAAYDISMSQRDIPYHQILAAQSGLATGVGARSVAGYSSSLTRAMSEGMDPGAAARMIGGSAAMGGGLGFIGMDPAIAEVLGPAAAGMMGPSSMMAAGGVGLTRMLIQGAGGGARGMRAAQQNIMGVQAQGALQGGFDNYQRSVNLATATSLMPTASPYIQNFLATSMADPNTLAAVMSGRLPRGMKSMGIDLVTAQQQASEVSSSILNRWKFTGDSRSERLMKQVQDEYGGNFGAFMRVQKDKSGAAQDLAPLLQQIAPELFTSVGAAEGFLRTSGGLATFESGGRGKRGGGTERDRLTEEWGKSGANLYRQQNRMEAKWGALEATVDGLDGSSERLTEAQNKMADHLERQINNPNSILGVKVGEQNRRILGDMPNIKVPTVKGINRQYDEVDIGPAIE